MILTSVHVYTYNKYSYIEISYKDEPGLCQKRDSSISTMTVGPPKTMGVRSNLVEQTSLSHLYTSTAVPFSTSASSAASVTGYCRIEKYEPLLDSKMGLGEKTAVSCIYSYNLYTLCTTD